MRSLKTLTAPALALSLCVPCAVSAQQPQPRQPGVQVQVQPGTQAGQRPQAGQTTSTQPGQTSQWQHGDQVLAGCVAIANQMEVAAAEFGRSKADGNDVKKFTDMLIQDHQAFLQQLQKFTPEAARDLQSQQPGQQSGQSQQTAQSQQSGVQTAAGTQTTASGAIQQTAGQQPAGAARQGHRGFDLLAIDREVAEKCLASMKEELGKKDGAEFDKCFMDMQIAAHAMMKDKLSVYHQHVSPELAKVLGEGLATTEQHLKQAKQIRKDMQEDGHKQDGQQNSGDQKDRE
jgi:predicted outer membrane protein